MAITTTVPVSVSVTAQIAPLVEEKRKTSLGEKLVAGAIAGIVGTSIIFPIDLVKTRLQNSKGNEYKGIVDCFRTIVAKEGGVKALYRGLGPNLVGVTPEKAIKLAVNEYARERFAANLSASTGTQYRSDKLPIGYEVASGALAGFCQVIATNPMEITKIQLQIEGSQNGGSRSSGLQVARELGLRGLYKHAGSTLCRDVPFSFLFFPMSARLKTLCADPNTGKVPLWGVFMSGIGAGAVAAAAVTPMDVVKTRLQSLRATVKYSGMIDCYKQILQHEGASALFKGAVPRMLIVAPLFAIATLVYEIQERILRGR